MSDRDSPESDKDAPEQAVSPRRHDLDVLRAFAMLLGIVLHVGLAYAPGFPWPVQDPNSVSLFGLIYPAIHGFRMPLFFLLSGYFTAMLWRRRGMMALLWHRLKRIVLPLIIGVFTIVPAVTAVGIWIMNSDAGQRDAAVDQVVDEPRSIFEAAAFGDIQSVDEYLEAGVSVDAVEPAGGGTPLSIAALFGHVELVDQLLQRGANVSKTSYDGGTALINATFLGRDQVVERLLEAGADPLQANSRGETPIDTTKSDWGTTRFLASLFKVPVVKNDVEEGRVKAVDLLKAAIGSDAAGGEAERVPDAERPKDVAEDGWLAQLEGAATAFSKRPLVASSYFHHLWFLWFLCIFVVAFVPYAGIVDALGDRNLPSWLVLSPVRFLYLIPITFVPSWFMGLAIPGFGPDTSTGLIPMPPVLIYYAVFFFFGAVYYDADRQLIVANAAESDAKLKTDPIGRWWWLSLPVALLVVLPVAMGATWGGRGETDPRSARAFAIGLQVIFTWLMTFGLIGLCRGVLSNERPWVRYLSDSSYWLYLIHVPLVLIGQQWLKKVDLHGGTKFLIVFGVVTGGLLVLYELFVRYTFIGTMLNGPRKRASTKDVAIVDVEAERVAVAN